MCEEYLLTYHKNTILEILENPDETKHFPFNLNFVELFENVPNLGTLIIKQPEKSIEQWNAALKKVQSDIIIEERQKKYILKSNIHFRVFGLPVCPELHRNIFPTNEDANRLLQVAGTVVRMSSAKMLEYQREYICTKCKFSTIVKADYEMKNQIKPPKSCSNPEKCCGTNLITSEKLDASCCKDYQEVKIQESVSKLEVGSIPNSMWVTLEDDLVDICKPGDNITVCGIVKRRWSSMYPHKKIDIELVLKANHIEVNNNTNSATLITPEIKKMFKEFWINYAARPLIARDIILKSFCPEIFGMYIVKLAICIVLAGGSSLQHKDTSTGVKIRAEPHLLLVGDPGTGKSQLLRFASKVIPRSVLTTGVGSTAAGLTVTAVMENGEWQLEGGALVLADGGICCIDEFNSMREHDRTSIHEAMEQQTISVAKASIVCKLSTRCTILASTNPKGGNLDLSQPLSVNIALASPLLSRFDLVLLIKDKLDENWDNLVVNYILNDNNPNESKLLKGNNWTVEVLQSYFAIIKKIHPVLTENSNRILSAYYQRQRGQSYRNKSRTTVRLLDSLVRLSQGHARLMFHDKVEIMDAIIAVVLVEVAMEEEHSLFDLKFDIHNPFPDDPTGSYNELAEIILNRLDLIDLIEEIKISQNYESSIEPPDFNKIFGAKKVESRFFFQKKFPDFVEEPQAGSCTNEENIEKRNKQLKKKRKKPFYENLDDTDFSLEDENKSNEKDEKKDLNRNKRKAKVVNENQKKKKLEESVFEEKIFDATQLDFENDIKTVISSTQVGENKEKVSKKSTKKSKQNKNINEIDLFEHVPGINESFNVNDIDFELGSLPQEHTEKESSETPNTNTKENVNCSSSKSSEEKMEKDDDVSQRTKRKMLLNKFRFVPKNFDSEEVPPKEENNTNEREKVNKVDEGKKKIESLKELDNKENEKRKKFNFKKNIKENLINGSIFDNEENLNDLDLNL